MRKHFTILLAALAAITLGIVAATTANEVANDTAPEAEAIMTGCTHGTNWSLCTNYNPWYKPHLDRHRVVVKCDGRWPISDYIVKGPSKPANAYSVAPSCGPWRTPRYVRTEQT